MLPLRPGTSSSADHTVFVVAAVDLANVLAIGVALFASRSAALRGIRARRAAVRLCHARHRHADLQRFAEQGQAIQLAIMTLRPEVLLSGLIFPLSSIVAGVRWIAYLLPLTYFNEIARGVMLRAEPWPSSGSRSASCAARRGGDDARDPRFRVFLAPSLGRRRGQPDAAQPELASAAAKL